MVTRIPSPCYRYIYRFFVPIKLFYLHNLLVLNLHNNNGFYLPSTSLSIFISITFLTITAMYVINTIIRYQNKNNNARNTYSPEIADVLGDVDIFTASGDSVMFKDLWDQSEGIAVVALLTHFGCPCSWELASTLKESIAKFEAAGVKLIAIGIGEQKKARIFAERLPFPLDSLYADPERKAYNLLGLYYGIGRTFFHPAIAKVLSRSRFKVLQKAVKNYTMEVIPDDKGSILQQGGMFVFKGKELLYAWKDEGSGDHAPLDYIFNI